METQIDRDALTILTLLASKPRDQFIPVDEIAKETNLNPDRVNDAVALLVDSGYAEWVQTMGTAPFDFADAYITSRGRYEHQRLNADAKAQKQLKPPNLEGVPVTAGAKSTLPPSPAGSPYGFTDEDWEVVSRHKARADRLYVVLGHQLSSATYDASNLRKNVMAMFEGAVQRYNNERRHGAATITLKFTVLAAGYGEHLFNQIARDIIGSDIAVFETSDLNANVMLEMGVALTWGVRVLPIKLETKPKPPSDISGQTWADYRNSGGEFIDPDHEEKLVAMIERAVRKKGR
jgi:hypothetical protein